MKKIKIAILALVMFSCSDTGLQMDEISSHDPISSDEHIQGEDQQSLISRSPLCLPDASYTRSLFQGVSDQNVFVQLWRYGPECGTWEWDGYYDIHISRNGVDEIYLGNAELYQGDLSLSTQVSIPQFFSPSSSYKYEIRRVSDGLDFQLSLDIEKRDDVISQPNTDPKTEGSVMIIAWDPSAFDHTRVTIRLKKASDGQLMQIVRDAPNVGTFSMKLPLVTEDTEAYVELRFGEFYESPVFVIEDSTKKIGLNH